MEFKLCEFLHCTPYELIQKRDENPEGIRFLQESFIYQWKEKKKAHDEAMRKARRRH